MAYNKQYKDFLEISPNFESVVDIDADKRNQTCGGNILLATTWKIWWMFYVSRLAMRPPDARRSFWVHGSYGTGKSYASYFCKAPAGRKAGSNRRVPVEVSRLSKYRNRFMKCRQQGRLSGDLEDRLHGHPHRRHDAGGS